MAKSLLPLVPCCRPFPRQVIIVLRTIMMIIKILITLDTRLVDEQGICPCEIYNSYEASSWHELDVQRKILQFVIGYSHP